MIKTKFDEDPVSVVERRKAEALIAETKRVLDEQAAKEAEKEAGAKSPQLEGLTEATLMRYGRPVTVYKDEKGKIVAYKSQLEPAQIVRADIVSVLQEKDEAGQSLSQRSIRHLLNTSLEAGVDDLHKAASAVKVAHELGLGREKNEEDKGGWNGSISITSNTMCIYNEAGEPLKDENGNPKMKPVIDYDAMVAEKKAKREKLLPPGPTIVEAEIVS